MKLNIQQHLISDFVTTVQNGTIPDKFPTDRRHGAFDSDWLERMGARDICTSLGMWAIVDKHWTANLAQWIGRRKVLEVMGGVGWLSKALWEHGVNVICTDDNSWRVESEDGTPCHNQAPFVFDVEEIEALEAVKRYRAADVLLVSWPPLYETKIADVLKAWGKDRPMIYIGELEGGCNAPDEFFDIFRYEFLNVGMPSWVGIHDVVVEGYLK